jgi:hypothetical protein
VHKELKQKGVHFAAQIQRAELPFEEYKRIYHASKLCAL